MALSFFRQLQKRNRDFQMEIDGRVLPIKVIENDRAKRLTLRLMPGGDGLKVTIPTHIGDDEIESFVRRNSNWAAARLSRLPKPVQIGVGQIIPYQGIDHEIGATGKLRGTVEIVAIDGQNRILVPGDEASIPRRLIDWMKSRARTELNEVVMHHSAKIGVRPKQIRITDTTSRWGSCSSTRTLSFSWRIIMAPPEVLDYLAAHEVAHLIEMNHSERFWNLTRELCPDMERHKHWLRINGTKLHAVKIG